MPHRRKILFLVDAGPQVGGGHVMRCLTLAAALTDLGADCRFMAPPEVQAILDRFAPSGLGAVPCAAPVMIAAGAAQAADLVVTDHYGLTPQDEAQVAAGRPLVVLDDLPTRQHPCQLLLDPSLGRLKTDYEGRVPAFAAILAGPSFALVRPAFAAARAETLARRSAGGAVGTVLVSLGLTDVGAITARVVEALLAAGLEAKIVAVTGQGAASLPRLSDLAAEYSNLSVLTDVQDMATLIAEADLAIGAGGSSTWERCCLGLAGITVVLADNQAALAADLDEAGVTRALDARDEGFDARLAREVLALTANEAARIAMSARAAALCDGLGAERAARRILAL
jgi:UDP-2,4-diacetamido-2,4,6-trideoxy-beta-L-altropyranose hydrolase